jgi:hypothetical protein
MSVHRISPAAREAISLARKGVNDNPGAAGEQGDKMARAFARQEGGGAEAET